VFLFFTYGTCVYAVDSYGTLGGTVIDKSSNTGIGDVKIGIVNLTTGIDYKFETTSDVMGKFIFEKIPAGTYLLSASRLGYLQIQSHEVTLKENETVNYNIYIEPADIQIERINVTAAKMELTLKQTPSSVSVVTQEDIKNRNLLTFDNLLQGVQGVTVFRTSGINVQSLSIRGSSDVAGGGIGNRVLLLLDGRPSLTGDSKGALWSLIPLSIIDRTEVVKGAFSSLYGSSAIGGVVNVITKKPTYKPYTVINLNYGFYEKLNDSLNFTDKLLSFKGLDASFSNTWKNIAYLVNVNYKQNDGHSQQTDYEFYGGLGKFMFDVLSNRDLEVTVQLTKSTSGFPHYWRKNPGSYAEPYKVAEHYIGDRIYKTTQSFDVFYTAIPGSETKYTSRFYYYSLYSTSLYNAKNPVAINYGTPGEPFSTYINSYNFGNISQVDYEISKRNYLIAGFDLQWNVVRSRPAEILYGSQQMNNFGVFVQDLWKIINNQNSNTVLSATIGSRIDYNTITGGNTYLQLSPKFSLLFSPHTNNIILENTAFRFLTGRAFRAPSIAEIFFKKELFGGFDFIYNPNLKPEEMISFEAGLRKQYDRRFTLDISVYINLYDNLIQYVNIGNSPAGPFQVQNIAKSQIRGIEAEINYTSAVQLFKKTFSYGFGVNYSFVDARDLSNIRIDEYLPYKPKHNLNFSVDLNYLDFSWNITGKYLSNVQEDLFYKYEEPNEYFILDTKLRRKIFDKLFVFIAVNNLLNTSYQELERTQAPNRSYNAGLNAEF
jgi:outer membrane cobalamin receptor